MHMIDSHCHLDFTTFADDLASVLQRSREQGVKHFLIPGTTEQGWQRQLQLHKDLPDVDIAFGLHPYFAQTMTASAFDTLSHYVAKHHRQLVAIGEAGLDATVETPMKTQQDRLEQQLTLAAEYHLPIILHHRKTHHLLIEMIKHTRFSQGGVIHAFSGSKQVANTYIDEGFKLGVGGTITYDRANKTRATLAQAPIEALLLETDSPDMPLAGFQGQRNTPQQLPRIAHELATLRGCPIEQVIEQTSRNYRQLFQRQ
ncbi:TatD family hydrolase [Salinimonas sediminis]|nr:TatD family hydrolase [Salinimonas sediminis]